MNPKFPVHKRVNPVHTVHTPVHTVHTPVHTVRNSVHNPELLYFSEISTPNSLRLVLAGVVLVGDVDDQSGQIFVARKSTGAHNHEILEIPRGYLGKQEEPVCLASLGWGSLGSPSEILVALRRLGFPRVNLATPAQESRNPRFSQFRAW